MFLIFVMFTLAQILCQYNCSFVLLLDLAIHALAPWYKNQAGIRVKNCQKKCEKIVFRAVSRKCF